MHIRLIVFLAVVGLTLGSKENGSHDSDDNDSNHSGHRRSKHSDESHEDDNSEESHESGSQEYNRNGICTNRYRQGNLEVVYAWKILKYNIPQRYSGLRLPSAERQYISGLSVTNDRIFLSPGGVFGRVPVTFATVPKNSCTKAPLLEPYPSFDWHVEAATRRNVSDCNKAFVTVYRSRLDSCNRIWVLDGGRLFDQDENSYQQLCPPKIVIFDLSTNKVVKVITIPSSVYKTSSVLTDVMLDEERQVGGRYRTCDDMMVYILDTLDSAIIVHDMTTGLYSRVTNEALKPDPRYGSHYVGGETYTVLWGVISQALSGDGRIYVQPFSSDKVYSLKISDLRDSLYTRQRVYRDGSVVVPVRVEFEKPCTAVGMNTFTRGGYNKPDVYYGPLCEYALYAWDPETNVSRRVTPRNRRILQVIEDIKPDNNDPNKIYMLTTREQKYFLDEVDEDEDNQRLISVDLERGYYYDV